MYARLVFLAVLTLIPSSAFSLQITEIMYDPLGTDSNHEWVEIYNNDTESYNITGWKLRTDTTDHTLKVPPANGGLGDMIIEPLEYAVIADNATVFLLDYPEYNITLIDSSFDLPNFSNETVVLKSQTDIFDNITYEPLAAEGNSTCLVNGSFIECIPTPGYENAWTTNYTEVNQTNTTQNNQTNITQDSVNPSVVSITGVENAKFGEASMVDIEIYKNGTRKSAVYVFVTSGDENLSLVSTFHAELKNSSYKFSIPVQIKSNCDRKYAEGTYRVVARGLEAENESSIIISGFSSNCKTITVQAPSGSSSGGGVAPKSDSRYSLIYPDILFIGKEFETIVRINATEKKKLSVYSYVYKGNTPVSEGFDGTWKGSWTANKQEIDVEPEKNYTVALRSRIEDETEPGIYTLRVKISGDEITREVEIRKEVKEKTVVAVAENTSAVNVTPNKPTTLSITGFAAQKDRNIDRIKIIQLFFILEKLFKK